MSVDNGDNEFTRVLFKNINVWLFFTIRFGKYLIDYYQLDPSKIHVMGHSLGAHISSYFGKGVPGLSRITAFDPAQPGFEGCPKEVRLDKSDADFVDVIHTSCRPTVPLLGFGLIAAVGNYTNISVYLFITFFFELT